jgi:GNAT superfamily N-acetyltransferase
MRPEPGWHVELLADHADLIPAVGELRYREWGHWGPEDLSWWVDISRQESGHTELPVTFVGLGSDGALAGAVGIDTLDPPKFADRGPWVVGVIVDPGLRGRGAGRAILGHTLRWAASQGYDQVWVATGPEAVGFYQRCGWELTETYQGHQHEEVNILRCRTGRLCELRGTLLAQRGCALDDIGAHEGEHLVGGRLVEDRPGGAQPAVQRALGQPDR